MHTTLPFWHAALSSNHLHEVEDDEPRNSSKCLDLVRIQVPINSIALTLIWSQRSHQHAWSDVVPGFDVATSTQPLYNCTMELCHQGKYNCDPWSLSTCLQPRTPCVFHSLRLEQLNSNLTQLHTIIVSHAWDHNSPVIDPHAWATGIQVQVCWPELLIHCTNIPNIPFIQECHMTMRHKAARTIETQRRPRSDYLAQNREDVRHTSAQSGNEYMHCLCRPNWHQWHDRLSSHVCKPRKSHYRLDIQWSMLLHLKYLTVFPSPSK
jgi:hypothetical protein